jgi:lysozyme
MDELVNRIIIHEGKSKSAYQDSLGYWTIGIGRLCDKRFNAGLSDDEMIYLLNNDIANAKQEMSHFSWFNKLNDVRQGVLIELNFNIGLSHLLEFKTMINYLILSDYKNAALAMLKSLWAKEVGVNRSTDMSNRLITGSY